MKLAKKPIPLITPSTTKEISHSGAPIRHKKYSVYLAIKPLINPSSQSIKGADTSKVNLKTRNITRKKTGKPIRGFNSISSSKSVKFLSFTSPLSFKTFFTNRRIAL